MDSLLKLVAGLREDPATKHNDAPDGYVEQIKHFGSLHFLQYHFMAGLAQLAS